MRRVLQLALLAGALCAGPAHGAAIRPRTSSPGAVPAGITYQGRLQQNGAVVNSLPRAPWGIVFKLYDSKENGNLIERLPPLTTMSYSIDIVSGLFNVVVPVSTNALVGGGQGSLERWLEVELLQPHQDPGTGQVMTPRGQLLSMPYALVAKAIEGTIDISTGGLVVTTGSVSGNTAFYISSTTAFNGIWTAHPYSMLTMSSGTLTLDGAGASIHLSSGAMAIDGAGANLDILGTARFGGAGTQSSFDAAGTLQLTSPLLPLSGGMGQDFHLATTGDIPYFSLAGVMMSPLGRGAANTILRSNGAIPAWTSATYPGGPLVKGSLLHASVGDAVSLLGIGTASTTLRSDATLPGWGGITYPGSLARGDLLYGWAASSVSLLGSGADDKVLQSNGTLPAWSIVAFPGSVLKGELLYGSAVANTVSRLPWVGTATRHLANTGASSSPAWDQVDLITGIKTATVVGKSNGGTSSDLHGAPAAQGSIPFFSNTNVMTTLGPTAGGAGAGWVLTTNGANTDPYWMNLEEGGPPAWATQNLNYGERGAVPFQRGASQTAMLVPVANGQILMSRGPGADASWTTARYPPSTTVNQILYSNAANTVGGILTLPIGILVTDGTAGGTPSFQADIPTGVTIGGGYIYRVGGTKVALADGGTSTDLSAADLGSLIYRAPGNLAGSGALTGVLKAASPGTPTALTGTTEYNTYWSDANTIAAERYTATSRGGTSANLSGVATRGLIYKAAAGLAGTGVLTGVLRTEADRAPTALSGTAGYDAYWVTASTIAAERYLSMSRGGASTDLSAATEGGLIYKAATKLAGTSVLPVGIIQGQGSAEPTALTGTGGDNVYWSDTDAIGARSLTPSSRGGFGQDLTGETQWGLIYYKASPPNSGFRSTGILAAGILKGGGSGVPTSINGTADHNAYWSNSTTLGGEALTPMSRGGLGRDLSLEPTGGLIYMDAGTTLKGTAALTGVLKGNGSSPPTALTGTADYNAYWSDANTIAAEQYTALSRGGLGRELSGEPTGGLIYMDAGTTLKGTAALTGVLKGNGSSPPTAMTGTSDYNAYWSDANTIAARQYIPLEYGGTGTSLSGLAEGSLIYKDAASLAGVALNGVLKGTGAGVPTALTGTAGYNTYWSDANTIAGEAQAAISRGGTNADLSGVDTGGVVYMAAAGLARTAALNGVLKGTGGAPTALTGTPNYNAYWFDDNTIKAELYADISRGGTGSALPNAATGGLIYKKTASTLDGTPALTGVLKGNGSSAPTALTGTTDYNAYWSDANTITKEQYTAISRGGTGATLASVDQGGLIYKTAGGLAGTTALSGVLKGNGTAAPSVATQADIGETASYKRYNPAAVAITGGSITATKLVLINHTWAELQGLTPDPPTGQMYYCTDCGSGKIAVWSGTNFRDVQGGALP